MTTSGRPAARASGGSPDSALFVGIDGGASRSTAVVVDQGGEVRARVHGAAMRVLASAPAEPTKALAALAGEALARAGAGPPARGLCCALTGAGRAPEQRALEAALAGQGIAERVRVIPDAEAALHDALGEGPGILLIGGTGSIALARTGAGEVLRVGGWGSLLGDEGSGYALGLAALGAVARAHDGRGATTALVGTVLAHAGVDEPPDLIAWVESASKREVAALAPAVAAAAAAGDAVAAELIAAAADDLAEHVRAAHLRGGRWTRPVTLALAGGLLASGGPLRAPLLAALPALDPALRPLEREVDAGRGAALLARRG